MAQMFSQGWHQMEEKDGKFMIKVHFFHQTAHPARSPEGLWMCPKLQQSRRRQEKEEQFRNSCNRVQSKLVKTQKGTSATNTFKVFRK